MKELDRISEAIEQYPPVVAVYALFSGGHDSLASTAIAAKHPAFTAVVHANTGIGIEETREFVRDTCRSEGWPLIEEFPDRYSYDDLVLQKGFPGGPKSHNRMYYYLKQRSVERVVQRAKHHMKDRVALVTGIRVSESVRRMSSGISVPIRRKGAQVWINPILAWSALDCNRFIDSEGLQRNRVVDLLHRSGECLCGALARSEEIHEIDYWFPDAANRIHDLEAKVTACGMKHSVWASRKAWGENRQMALDLEMCSSCQLRVVQ